jgi:hypothetical protein
MTQETALDWFIEKIGYQKDGEWYIGIREDVNIQHWVDQVRQMQKEQIEDAYIMGSYDMASKEFKPGKYYNEIYGKD